MSPCSQCALLLNRQAGWCNIVGGLHAYLSEMAQCEGAYARAYGRLATLLPSTRSDFGVLMDGVGHLAGHARFVEERHAQAASAVDLTAVQLLHKVLQLVTAEVAAVSAEFARLESSLHAARVNTLIAHDAFQKVRRGRGREGGRAGRCCR